MRSLRIIGNINIGIFLAIAIGFMFDVYLDLIYNLNLRGIAWEEFVDESLVNAIVLTRSILTLTCPIVFLIWFYRAHKNLVVSGLSGLRYTPQWAVVGFFIPIINFARPCQVMNEVWRNTVALYNQRAGTQAKIFLSNAMVGTWWGAFLAASLVGFMSAQLNREAKSPEQFVIADWVWFTADLLAIPAALTALFLIWRITSLQERIRNRPTSGDQLSMGIGDAPVLVPPKV